MSISLASCLIFVFPKRLELYLNCLLDIHLSITMIPLISADKTIVSLSACKTAGGQNFRIYFAVKTYCRNALFPYVNRDMKQSGS